MSKARSFIPRLTVLALCAVLAMGSPVAAQVFSVPLQGASGTGLAAGGAASTILTKLSVTSFDTAWTTATYPSTTTINQLLYSSAANTIAGLTTANSGLLVTSGTGVPSIGTDIPTAVTIGTAYIYRVGGTDVAIADGGTGAGTAQAAIDALTAVSGATNENFLTKDTATGNAIFKAAGGGVTSVTGSGNIASSGGTTPNITFTGVLPIANGGTAVGTFTTNGVLYGNGTTSVLVTAQGGTNTILTASAGAPAWSATPILNTSLQLGVVSTATGSLKLAHASSANLTTITAGNATAAVTYVWPTADGTSGQVLSTNASGVLSWATAAGGGSVATDTIWDAKGDLAGGTGANTAARLAVGTNNYFLVPDSAETTGLKWLDLFGTANTWTATQQISGAVPQLNLQDTTASAKSLRIYIDGDTANFQELADGSALFHMDLVGRNVGIGIGASSAARLRVRNVDNSTILQLEVEADSAGITAADTFINFQAATGGASVGSVAGTAVSGVIAYNTFTGSHYTQVEDADRVLLKPGMLLEATGEPLNTFPELFEADRLDAKGETIKGRRFKALTPGHLVRSRIARTKGSKAAYGVYGGTDKEGRDLVLALGSGPCIVKNTGVNLAIGDYLIASDVAGAMERQADDVYRNSTVAKAMQPVVWDGAEPRRRIPCVYLGG